MLIDTHCHVHVSPDPPPGKSAAECCNLRTPTSITKGINIYHGSSVPQLHTEGSRASDKHKLVSDNEGHPAEKGETEGFPALLRVVHITMGIREDDWPKAIDFARADNLDPVAWQLTARATRENVVQQERSSVTLGKEATGERDGAGDASPAAAVVARAPFFRFGVGLHPWWVDAEARSSVEPPRTASSQC